MNPYADEVMGREAVDSLSDADAEFDLVNVFRPSDEVPGVVDEAIARTSSLGDVRAVWLQSSIVHDEAAARAEAAGLDVVQDRCMKVGHRRLIG